MSITVTTRTTAIFPLQPKPLLRCYRHIVGEQVWRKLLEYVYCRHITQSAGELLKYLDYEPGSTLEGNLIHWQANRRKSGKD